MIMERSLKVFVERVLNLFNVSSFCQVALIFSYIPLVVLRSTIPYNRIGYTWLDKMSGQVVNVCVWSCGRSCYPQVPCRTLNSAFQ